VTPDLTRLLELWRASTFRDFSGAQLELRVPLTDAVLNQVAAVVAARQPGLRALTVTVRSGNRIDLRVELAQPAWLPPFTIPLSLHSELEYDPDQTVVAEIRPGLAGAAARLAGPLGVRRPAGIDLSGRCIRVRLMELAPEGEARVFTSWIRSGRFDSQPGVLWVTLRLSVP